jgi:hypothetical protein
VKNKSDKAHIKYLSQKCLVSGTELSKWYINQWFKVYITLKIIILKLNMSQGFCLPYLDIRNAEEIPMPKRMKNK